MKNNILELYTAVQSEGSRIRPTIVVRTSGCTHRCYFGENNWCDSWYTSVHPEKPLLNILDVEDMINSNPQINEIMLTGGSPTMHKQLIRSILDIAHNRKDGRRLFITIETEGSHWYEELEEIDLVSFSPKLSNSVPQLGTKTPLGVEVTQKLIDQHNKFRMNVDVQRQIFTKAKDYQYKPVWGGDEKTLNEIIEIQKTHNIPNEKIYVMPAGADRDILIKNYPIVMEKCIEMGWSFTGRPHIIAYGDRREV